MSLMKGFFFSILLLGVFAQSQTAVPFAEEVASIQKKYDTIWDASKETVVFTGSSSIRFWKNLQDIFPNHQIVNSGFGGSQASDLLLHTNELILRYKPRKVFIYEGDNDISAGKRSKVILSDVFKIIDKIRQQNPATEVVLIAAKPSIARWNLKGRYKRLNRKFKKMSRQNADISFIDVWNPMLNGRKLKQDIFIKDGLHMNAKGYAIWYAAVKPFLDDM